MLVVDFSLWKGVENFLFGFLYLKGLRHFACLVKEKNTYNVSACFFENTY
jgi:hypothetical protein